VSGSNVDVIVLRIDMKSRDSVSPASVPKEKVVHLYRRALEEDIPLEMLHQKIHHFLQRNSLSTQMEEQADLEQQKLLKMSTPLFSRIFLKVVPAFCIITGIFLLGNAIFPIASYYLFQTSEYQSGRMLSPIPPRDVLEAQAPLISQVKAETQPFQEEEDIQPTLLTGELDFTNLSNWFPDATVQAGLSQAKVEEYRLDIPELNIENAIVKIGGTNLDRSLIQYPGTAAPGDPGAGVIFGHSVLRQFYNPSIKNPRRYFSIFSKIMTLKPGDKIYITYNNVQYTYRVKGKTVVKPEDIYILNQQYDVHDLKLVTCVPEGTLQSRGVVIAELVADDESP
jgi:LPXTG-site transpeptidase (sortase) family protein